MKYPIKTKVANFLSKYALWIIVALCLLLFSPALGGFFSSDDWFIFRIAQIQNIREFGNFFTFLHTDQYAGSYRPLSTQLFFWSFYQLFRLNPLPYFIFGLTLFGLTLVTLYRLLIDLRFSHSVSLLSIFLYGFSATNFPRLNFIGAYNELFLALFVLLALRLYHKNNCLYLLFFIFALLSKETAVIFLGLLILVDWFTNKKLLSQIKYYVPTAIITTAYLYLRFFVFPSTEGDSYVFDPSLKKTANTLMWYFLWALGTPEFLVDYVGSGLKVVPKFFTDIPVWSKAILIQLGLVSSFFVVTVLASLNRIKTVIKPYLFGTGIFLVSLLPVLFFPWHKFTHLLTLPLIGLVIILATAAAKKKPLGIFLVVAYLFVNLTTIGLLTTRHYSVTRGRLAYRVYTFFTTNYPNYPTGQSFRFVNDGPVTVREWGLSKQISQAISGSEFFRVVYQNKTIKAYFDDLDSTIPATAIPIGSSQFLR